jgi:hypothetical protein
MPCESGDDGLSARWKHLNTFKVDVKEDYVHAYLEKAIQGSLPLSTSGSVVHIVGWIEFIPDVL